MGPDYYAETEPKAGDPEGRINHVLRRAPAEPAVGDGAPGVGGAPAAGGAPAVGGTFEVRHCRVIGFAELLWFFGNEFTAAELHAYWCNARRVCIRRQHPWTSQDRKAASREHHTATGRWGLGRRVAVGDTAWSGRIPRDPKGKGKGKRKGKGEKKGDA